MTAAEIQSKLIDGIAAILNKESSQVDPSKPFHELGIDSLGLIEVLVFIEKTFKLQLINTDLAKNDFETIHNLASFISKKL